MKTLKMMAVGMTALLSTFTMSSCLGSSSDSTGVDAYNVPVTVVESGLYGTYFYADMGCTLVPTSSSLSQVTLTNVRRAMIAFSFTDENVSATTLTAGGTYNVALEPSYCYSIPTYDVIDRYNNEEADSLQTRQTGISTLSTSTFYVTNGFLTTQLTLPYTSGTAYSLNVLYNSQEDVDVENNKVTLNLLYSHNATQAYYTGSSVFSFKLPSGLASKFQGDSVTVEMRALSTSGSDNYLTAKTKAALSDLTTRYGK